MRVINWPVTTLLLLLAVNVYSSQPDKAECDYDAIEKFDINALKKCIEIFKEHFGSEELQARIAGEQGQDSHDPHFSAEVAKLQLSLKTSPELTLAKYGTGGHVDEETQPKSEGAKPDLETNSEDVTRNRYLALPSATPASAFDTAQPSATPASAPETAQPSATPASAPETAQRSATPASAPETAQPSATPASALETAQPSEPKNVVTSSGKRGTELQKIARTAAKNNDSSLQPSTSSSSMKKPIPNSAPAELYMWRNPNKHDGRRNKVVSAVDPREKMKKVAAEAAAAARDKTFLRRAGRKRVPKVKNGKKHLPNSVHSTGASSIPHNKHRPSLQSHVQRLKKSKGTESPNESEHGAFGADASYGLSELFGEKDHDEESDVVVEAKKHEPVHDIPQSEAELMELALRILEEVFVIQRYRLGYFRSVAEKLPFFSAEPIVTSDGVLVKVAREKMEQNGRVVEMIGYWNSCVYNAANGAFWAFDPVPPTKNAQANTTPQWYQLTDEAIALLVLYHSAIRSPEVAQKLRPPCFCHYGCERLAYAGSDIGLQEFRQAFIAKALATTSLSQPPLTWQLKIPAANKALRLNKGGVAALSILSKSGLGSKNEGGEILLRGTCLYAVDISGTGHAHPQIWVLNNPRSADLTTISSQKWIPLRGDAGFPEHYWIWRWVQVLAGKMLSFPCHCQSCSKVTLVVRIGDGNGWREYKVDGSSLPPLSDEQKRLFIVDESIEQYWEASSNQHWAIPSFKWERVGEITVMGRQLAKAAANAQSSPTTNKEGIIRYVASWEKAKHGIAHKREWIRVQPEDESMMVHEDDREQWSVYPETCVYKFVDEDVYAYNNPDYHYMVSHHGVGWKKLMPAAAKRIHENAAAITESMQCRSLPDGEKCEYDFQQCSNVLGTECYCERCCQLAVIGERQLTLDMVAQIGAEN